MSRADTEGTKLLDLEGFLQAARSADSGLARGREAWIARAPGRLDVIGGVGDYSGALVLEMPIAPATWAAAQLTEDGTVRLHSPEAGSHGMSACFRCDLREVLVPKGGDPGPVRERFASRPEERWAAYAAGALTTLSAAGKLPPNPRGIAISLVSQVPLGAGVSSSAALEVAAMMAVDAAYGIGLAPLETAELCQRVENQVAGAPCGIMDQITCVFGEAGRLLAIRCRPYTLEGQASLPPGMEVVGLDSGVKHSVGGGRYRRARVATFMGRRILQEQLGKPAPDGYLTEWGVRDFRALAYPILPARMRGDAFLQRYGETGDPATRVDPEATYSVRACAMHAVYENERVARFRELLLSGRTDERALLELGRLMLAAHWSYGKLLGLGSAETDLLVSLARRAGPAQGLYGAKITGGGSGGVVAILARKGSDAAIEAVRQEYRARTGLAPALLRGSSPGALAFGVRKVVL